MMYLIRLSIFISILFHSIFSAYLFNPENIALSEASSIAYDDFRSINPASIASHKGLTFKLFGVSAGMGNNFLSISNYNDINGANFEDPTASKYYSKSDVYSLFKNGIRLNSQSAINLPFSDLVFNNISFSSRTYCMIDAGLPRALVKLALYGNELNTNYNLNLDNSVHLFSEHSIGYSQKTKDISLGFRLKYIQGLAYGEFINLSDNSSYFYTDSSGFLGKAEYLINQGIGGSGLGVDIGIIYEFDNTLNIGVSLNNLFARIKWDDNNFTYNFLRNSIISNLPLRHNEKQYYSINLDTLNAMSMMNTSIDEIYVIENFPIIEFNNIDEINFEVNQEIDEGGDTILVSNYGDLIKTEYDSYLLRSDNISDSLIKTFNLDIEQKSTNYPTYFNLSVTKLLDENITFCLDLSTGFSNSLRNSKNWKLSSGLLFNRFKNIPITLGVSFGGTENINSGFSIGYKKGPILINYGFRVRDGIFLQSMKGLDVSFNLIFRIN